MTRRPLAAGAAAALTLALVACSTSATTATGTAPITTGEIAPAPTSAAPAPGTTLPPVPATPAGVASTRPTTSVAVPAPAALVGPPVALATLLESPLATRREPSAPGVMVRVSNPAFDRSFVVTLVADGLASLSPTAGWTVTPLARDPQWTPGSCGDTARVFVGRRWEVYVDAVADPGGKAPLEIQLVSFDTRTGTMTSYLETPNRVEWITTALFAYDDHTVGVLFDPRGRHLGAEPPPARDLALRRIDLATGHATDVAMPSLTGAGYRSASFETDGSVTLFVEGDPQRPLRWTPGSSPVVAPQDAREATAGPIVDGARLDYAGLAPDADVPVRDAGGKVLARVHPWRLWSQGGVGLIGWSQARGYFGAVRDDPRVDPMATVSLGVFDSTTGAWTWALAPPARPEDTVGFFLIGTS